MVDWQDYLNRAKLKLEEISNNPSLNKMIRKARNQKPKENIEKYIETSKKTIKNMDSVLRKEKIQFDSNSKETQKEPDSQNQTYEATKDKIITKST